MSKENESGRVLPWQHMKNIISDIYEERLKSELDMISGMVGNAMLFDEFVVFYFLKKQKIRRLAEVKVLEFIISLKYYSRFWIKA
jgi:ribosome recycling factor